MAQSVGLENPEFPLTVTWACDEPDDVIDDKAELVTTLEDFNSDDPDCGTVRDARGRGVALEIRVTRLVRFELVPNSSFEE